MNKLINVVLLFISIPTLGLAIYDGFDLPIEFLKTSGAQIPYKFEIYLLLGMFIFVACLRRSIRRWLGAWMLQKKARFLYNEEVSSKRKLRVITYLFLESLVMITVAYGLYRLSRDAWFPALAFLFGAVDGLIFGIVGSFASIFRVAISSKAVIAADREVSVLYFEGLRKVSVQQQSIFFDYIKGLQLLFPSNVVKDENKNQFQNVLIEQIDRDQVFVTDSFKQF